MAVSKGLVNLNTHDFQKPGFGHKPYENLQKSVGNERFGNRSSQSISRVIFISKICNSKSMDLSFCSALSAVQ